MIVRLFALLAVLCVADTAVAQNVWSAPGSACVPSAGTIATGSDDTGVAFVRHAEGSTDPIALTCAMDRFNSGTGEWNLKIVYRDSTGSSSTALVRAKIYRMAIGSSSAVLLATATSDSSASTALNTASSPQFTHMFDFEANSYWVRVEIQRSANQTAIFHAAVLDGTAF